MHYTEISTEQQKAMIKGRIAGWESEHFGHEINRRAFLALPPGDDRDNGIKSSDEALAVLASSIEAGRKHLAELDTPAPTA